MGRIQGSDLDGEAEGFAGVVEGDEAVDGVVTVAVGHRDEEGQLAAVAEGVGGQFVEAVAVDPALAVVVPAPEGQRVAIGARAVTVLMGFLAAIVQLQSFLPCGLAQVGSLLPSPAT